MNQLPSVKLFCPCVVDLNAIPLNAGRQIYTYEATWSETDYQ